ncbi:MAG: hypothetical protein RL701_6702 [Pseudomonadota bacterium]|jgi:hypothetical protein
MKVSHGSCEQLSFCGRGVRRDQLVRRGLAIWAWTVTVGLTAVTLAPFFRLLG